MLYAINRLVKATQNYDSAVNRREVMRTEHEKAEALAAFEQAATEKERPA